MTDLSTNICNIKFSNPLVLASGVRGNNANLLIRAAKEGAGAVTSKSCSLKAREGHNNPTVINNEFYMLNAVGLSNPGVELEIDEIKKAKENAGIPIIASVYANTIDDFALVAKKISIAKPDIIELDISCPNVHKEGQMFSSTKDGASNVVKAVKKEIKNIPISAKLAANVPNIGEIAKECEKQGANLITAINTMPAMQIDLHAKRPILHNRYGGLSGPAIFPIALRAVNEISNTCNLPIIGGGGVTTGEDAAKMLMAGASLVSVGSALYWHNDAFSKIKNELINFMKKENYQKINQIKFE